MRYMVGLSEVAVLYWEGEIRILVFFTFSYLKETVCGSSLLETLTHVEKSATYCYLFGVIHEKLCQRA